MRLLKTLFGWLFALIFVAVAASLAGWVWLNTEVNRPGPLAKDAMVKVEAGESLSAVAQRLETDGIIRQARLMTLKARVDGSESGIKTGEYVIEKGATTRDVLSVLTEGRAILHKITLPEGRTTAQLLKMIEEDEVLLGDMPGILPEEGTLLPDTYMFHRGMTRQELITKMKTAQTDLLAELWPKRQDGLPFTTKEEAIILASVVEKESGKPEDRSLVAGLFVGRLRNGMRLQSDPTIIYGISRGEPLYNSKGERRTLYQSEIDRQTEWNTYQVDGLPKTAIANPGRDALAAVLNPPTTDYVFFVAECKDGVITGDHVFSKTLAEHNRAVAEFRACEKREIERERAN